MTREGSDARYPPEKRRAEGDRHFAENGARNAPAQRSFDAVDQLDDLDLAGENRVERAVSALMNGEFSGTEMQVGGRLRETLEFGNSERREQRNRPDVVNRQHGFIESRKMEQTAVMDYIFYLSSLTPNWVYLLSRQIIDTVVKLFSSDQFRSPLSWRVLLFVPDQCLRFSSEFRCHSRINAACGVP